jgi:hypothetical protein
MAGDSLVAKNLKEKCINADGKLMIGNIEDLNEILYEQPKKYITDALLPTVKEVQGLQQCGRKGVLFSSEGHHHGGKECQPT